MKINFSQSIPYLGYEQICTILTIKAKSVLIHFGVIFPLKLYDCTVSQPFKLTTVA